MFVGIYSILSRRCFFRLIFGNTHVLFIRSPKMIKTILSWKGYCLY